MNIGVNSDGSFNMDNNWGSKFDLARVSDAQVNQATNPHEWNCVGRNGRIEPLPDGNTPFRPGSGRNPNETEDEYNKRLSDEKKSQDGDKDKLKEQEQQRHALQLKQQKEQYEQAQAAYQNAKRTWEIEHPGIEYPYAAPPLPF